MIAILRGGIEAGESIGEDVGTHRADSVGRGRGKGELGVGLGVREGEISTRDRSPGIRGSSGVT